MFIDTHTHYYDEGFPTLQEADDAIARAVAAGVGKMIQADISSHERTAMFEMGARHPGVLYQMLGLYPGSVGADWKEEIDRLLPYLEDPDPAPEKRIVAIGEIGLDYHEGRDWAAAQREALRVQFELAAQYDLPVNIHLRDATEDFIRIARDAAPLHLRGNLHCFGLSLEVYNEIRRWGDWRVGIGGVVTFKNASLARTVADIPLERILLETDCPYLAPTPYRGHRNESAYIPLIAEKIAEIKAIPLSEVEAVTTASALELFQLS